ncbi:hypothetical protein [Thermomonas haemolytica]|uniref:DUF4124 domain-containing protein n=1 Tax=Thermomonas haemolytica TaxID=141949 RepID=A0A4V2V228_9GAMM|nr:hypothetical protein [Thermomonas haemolytica]TCT23452.1 hypothetical protein EDC34_10542 [Thermomonas haemolytica]TNY28509.1 hypothetical protein BV505_10060 [Thermomonas haemolytica]
MPRIAPLLLPALLLGPLPAPPVQAQVRQCLAADGTRIYTDRQCGDIAAREAPAALAAGAGGALLTARGGCARSVEDLADALERALQAGDANQLAALYDWAGMGSAAANAVLDQLQRIAGRPLVGVHARTDEATGAVTGLVAEQVDGNGRTPRQAGFGLRRRMGCLWLTL